MANSKADDERLKLLEEGRKFFLLLAQLTEEHPRTTVQKTDSASSGQRRCVKPIPLGRCHRLCVEYRKVIEGTRQRIQEARRGMQDAAHREQLTQQLRKTADEESIS
jgi:hypothetical protein